MKIYKIERVGKIEIEVGVECDAINNEVKSALKLLEITLEEVETENIHIEEESALNIIIGVLRVTGFIDKKELKNLLRVKVSSNEIEKIIKELKGEIFKYKKDGDDWLVGLIEDEESTTTLSDFDYLKFEKLF